MKYPYVVLDEFGEVVFDDFIYWLRAETIEAFPREVSLRRKIADSFDSFIKYVDCCILNNEDSYSAVFSSKQLETCVFDTIFLDVDEMVFADYVRDAIKTADLDYREYYSGRGAHFYIDFEPIKMTVEEYKFKSRLFVSQFLGVDLMVDMHVVGDVRRMARLPYTFNTRSRCMMIPIKRVCSIKRNRKVKEIFDNLKMEERSVCDLQNKSETIKLMENAELPPCVEMLLRKAIETGELEHVERLIVATFLLQRFSIDEVERLFSILNDYNSQRTIYQLEWLLKRNYVPFSCRKIRSYGLCPSSCKFYPWMGKVF